MDALGAFNFFHVGCEAARFHSEYKVLGSCLAPRIERREVWQMIMSCVDLNRVEMLGIKCEHVLRGEFLRVKRSQPVFIVPAGGADVDFGRHDCFCSRVEL